MSDTTRPATGNEHLEAIKADIRSMREGRLDVTPDGVRYAVVPKHVKSIEHRAEALAAELRVAQLDLREAERIYGSAIDYAVHNGERDRSMGQPQPRRHPKPIKQRLQEVEAERDELAAQIEWQQRLIDMLEAEVVSAYEGDDTAYALINVAHKRAREHGDLPEREESS